MTRIKKANTANVCVAIASAIVVFAVVILISQYNTKVTVASSSPSNVLASANVQAYCQISISNTVVYFNNPSYGGGPYPGNSEYTVNLIVANTVGNAAGNIQLFGSSWTYLSNSFAVGNTLWSATSSGSSTIGTALTGANVNTAIPLVLLAGSIVSNNIYFGVNIPIGQAPGIYTQNVEFSDSCTGSNTQNSIFTVNIQPICGITLSNTLIAFGNINPGSNTPFTSNEVSDTNTGGDVPTNILVEGTVWSYAANTFVQSNTVWAAANVAYTSGTGLLLYPGNLVDTSIQIAYPPTSSVGNVFFGVAVPPGEPAGVYTQNIVIENKC